MKKLFLCLVLSLLFFLGKAPAYADAVYLNNGKVMRGRIVEKNQDYIVLKTGEGESVARTTIYHEDINKIQSEQEYSTSIKFIPTQLFKNDFKKLWEKSAPLPIPVETDKQESLAYNNEEAIENISPLKVSAAAVMPRSRLFVGRGIGSVYGYVKLPTLSEGNQASGNLYVCLMRNSGNGYFGAGGGNMAYQVIGGVSAASSLVPYKIDNVESGFYRVFILWDTASPYVKEKVVNGADTIIGIGLKGDYMWMQPEELKITEDDPHKVVNAENLIYLPENLPWAELSEKEEYQVADLYYRKIAFGSGELILFVKNLGAVSIEKLEFDLFVNDEEVNPGPLVIGPLGPDEEREFDISDNFEAYRKQKEEKGVVVIGKMARFKIIKHKSGALELEKAIFML